MILKAASGAALGTMASVTSPRKRVLLAKPRGYCAGVDRAVQTVEKALELYGPPVYVRKEIVHNKHVVNTLRARGAIFVEENDEVPEGAIVVFSAHGVAPEVHEQAKARSLRAIDATCPLVTKVHVEARRFAADDYDILLIGHEGHEEVVGTTGEAPAHIQLVDGPDAVDKVTVRDPSKVVWLSQTTLSVDETMETVARLRTRLPLLQSPPSDDICYATQNRQQVVKEIAPDCDVVIVVGSRGGPGPACRARIHRCGRGHHRAGEARVRAAARAQARDEGGRHRPRRRGGEPCGERARLSSRRDRPRVDAEAAAGALRGRWAIVAAYSHGDVRTSCSE
jgi:4-hydroxy-3-methylbut-2-enyl diphosphate reductase